MLLAPCAPLAEMSLTRASAALELYAFVGGGGSDVQAREAEFVVSRDGTLNAIGVRSACTWTAPLHVGGQVSSAV